MEIVKIIADVGMTLFFIIVLAFVVTWIGEKI